MERNLCVSDSVDDEVIESAWDRLFWNNAIERIERRGSKKIIHLHAYLGDEDELAEIMEIYEFVETFGKVTVFKVNVWMYGSDGIPENNCDQFDVCFE